MSEPIVVPVGTPLTASSFNTILGHLSPFLSPAKEKQREVSLDFSSCQFVQPGGLAPLTLLLQGIRKAGHRVSIQKDFPGNYANVMGFHRYIETDGITDLKLEAKEGYVPLSPVSDRSNIDPIVEQVLDVLSSQLDLPDFAKDLFFYCISEVIANTRHADVQNYPLVHAQAYPKWKKVEFCVADAGIGIHSAMTFDQGRGFRSDLEAIEAAVEKHARGAGLDVGKGIGLYDLERLTTKNDGTLSIRSGSGGYAQSTSEARRVDTHPYWSGTIVDVFLRTDVEENYEDFYHRAEIIGKRKK